MASPAKRPYQRPSPRTFKDLLIAEGWPNKWHAQVMADILLPLIPSRRNPAMNTTLVEYKSDPYHMRALFLVKEVFRNLGLVRTENIFEAEAGLQGLEETYKDTLDSDFALLTSSKAKPEPPLLSQILYLVTLRNRRQIAPACANESIQLRFGLPQNLRLKQLMNRSGMAQDLEHEPLDLDAAGAEESFMKYLPLLHSEEELHQLVRQHEDMSSYETLDDLPENLYDMEQFSDIY